MFLGELKRDGSAHLIPKVASLCRQHEGILELEARARISVRDSGGCRIFFRGANFIYTNCSGG